MPLLGGIRDTLSQIRHRRPQRAFCPRCGSPDIHPVPNYGFYPEKYRCEKCGYEGVIVLELEKDPDVIQGKDREAL